jgi:hypothetical protein
MVKHCTIKLHAGDATATFLLGKKLAMMGKIVEKIMSRVKMILWKKILGGVNMIPR